MPLRMMIGHISGDDPAGISVVLRFAETLTAAAGEATKFRRRRALVLYFGLDGDAAWTLQAIADAFGVTREAVRKRRDRAVDDLLYRSLADDANGICFSLVEQARTLAKQFDADPVRLLETFEAGPATKSARDWVTLVLRLAGRHPRTAAKLVGQACRRQRDALLAIETDRRAAAREGRTTQRRTAALARFLEGALRPHPLELRRRSPRLRQGDDASARQRAPVHFLPPRRGRAARHQAAGPAHPSQQHRGGVERA